MTTAQIAEAYERTGSMDRTALEVGKSKSYIKEALIAFYPPERLTALKYKHKHRMTVAKITDAEMAANKLVFDEEHTEIFYQCPSCEREGKRGQSCPLCGHEYQKCTRLVATPDPPELRGRSWPLKPNYVGVGMYKF